MVKITNVGVRLIPSEYTVLLKYRDEVNRLVDDLSCTRSSAVKIIQAAMKEGYEWEFQSS